MALMSRRRVLVLSAVLPLIGCFKLDVPPGKLRCDETRYAEPCPEELVCVHGYCELPGAVDIGAVDAATPDAALSDAQVADADGGGGLAAWKYRKQITVSKTMTTGSHQGFPLLVALSGDADLAAHAQPDGDDLVFVLSGATDRLHHEIERYDPVAGDLWAWVRLPVLEDSKDTVLWLYYGNQQVASQQSAAQVWSGGYEAVWHLGDDPTTGVPDATGRHAAGTAVGAPASADGKIGKAVDFDKSCAIDVGTFDVTTGGPTGLTLEAWVFWRDASNHGRIISKAQGKASHDHWWMLGFNAPDQVYQTLDVRVKTGTTGWAGVYLGQTPGGVPAGLWAHYAATWDGSLLRIYRDGNEVSQTCDYIDSQPCPLLAGNLAQDATVPVWIGGNPVDDTPPKRRLDGLLDEVRVSGLARSAEWLATQVRNQGSPSTYLVVGSEEPAPGR